MRIVSEATLAEFKVTVFSWNQKYLIKFEQPQLEQTYKLSADDVRDEKDIARLIANEAFMAGVRERFSQMRKSLHDLVEG